jgi:hypothetical protein
MLDEIFVIIIFLALALLFRWAFKILPAEQWQIIGCIPYRRLADGHWQGLNLTWYGFFNAGAMLFALGIFLTLMGSLSTPFIAGLALLALVLAACLPAARIMAYLIEKKLNTFSVGGASFIGILIAPWIIFLTNLASHKWFGFNISVINALAAMSIAYAFGEGVGRLACISFGCCYGTPLAECSALINRIFRRHNFVFTGKTKKIAYAHGFDGQPVIPIQALTAIIYSFIGLVSCYLFLKGFTTTALLLSLTGTQLWRALSEFLRADYRGEGKISGYQMMASIACLYGVFIAYLFGETSGGAPDLALGLAALWNPAVLIILLVFWILTFCYMGRSKVTAALIEISVLEEKS